MSFSDIEVLLLPEEEALILFELQIEAFNLWVGPENADHPFEDDVELMAVVTVCYDLLHAIE